MTQRSEGGRQEMKRAIGQGYALGVRFAVVSVLLVLTGCGPSLETLVRQAKSASAPGRAEAARQLARRKDAAAVEPLMALLHDTDSRVRREAIAGLGAVGKPAIEPLLRALRSRDDVIRDGATRALVAMGPRAVPCLIPALSQGPASARQAAMRALGLLRDPRAAEPLARVIRNTPGGDATTAAALALKTIGTPHAIQLLTEVFLAPSCEQQYYDVGIVLGVGTMISYLEGSDVETRRRAAEVLSDLQDPRAGKALVSSMRQHDLSVVAGAREFFIRKGLRESVPLLVAALERYPDIGMAADFIFCGNRELARAGRAWATAQGYRYSVAPDGWKGVRWGSERD